MRNLDEALLTISKTAIESPSGMTTVDTVLALGVTNHEVRIAVERGLVKRLRNLLTATAAAVGAAYPEEEVVRSVVDKGEYVRLPGQDGLINAGLLAQATRSKYLMEDRPLPGSEVRRYKVTPAGRNWLNGLDGMRSRFSPLSTNRLSQDA